MPSSRKGRRQRIDFASGYVQWGCKRKVEVSGSCKVEMSKLPFENEVLRCLLQESIGSCLPGPVPSLTLPRD
jgi:hypothetical protein